jgi:hypothetical protein
VLWKVSQWLRGFTRPLAEQRDDTPGMYYQFIKGAMVMSSIF